MILREKLRAFVKVHLAELLPTKWAQTAVQLANDGYIEESKLVPLCLFCGVYGFNKKLIEVNDIIHFEEFLIEYNAIVKDMRLSLFGHDWELNLNVVAIEAIIIDLASCQYSYEIVSSGVTYKLSGGKMKII